MALSIKLQNKYFQLAKNVSTLSDFNKQYHIGCVVIYKNKVIADGYNTKRTSPTQKRYNKYRNFNEETINNGALHAEIMALTRCKEMSVDWNKVYLFVYREHKNGNRAISRPCLACMNAIKDRGIKKIYYTGDNSYIYERID